MKTLDSKKKSRFERVEPGLFRYKPSGSYYTVLKKDGKTKWRNLQTDDKATARRMLADEREADAELDSNLSGLEISQLTDKYLESIASHPHKTLVTRRAMINRLLAHFPAARKVREIKPSDLSSWIASLPVKAVTQNEYARVMKEIFKIALADRVILKSPAAELKRRKVHDPVRLTPSWEQFKAIVGNVRAQVFNADCKDSSDFLEFMGLAGLGQAELKNLSWNDVDLAKNRMKIRRVKTGRFFDVPIYPQLRPLLERLHAERGDSERVLKISDGKKALNGACKRLGYPAFTQRALRRAFITRAIELGLDFKVIAQTQGHSDGGVLVAKTYGHLRQEHLEAMAAKLVA
jgi:integrase